ncbi:hypothetical protein KIW84_010475 [Lathyrus oleraceus]|uniref:Ubiquitin-like protease family profile domain-containing protein n=1 Tax=Pisum sativum TaxID=3888 RepID=A0A9D4YP11_PEA|nr:hypothetical protein KIW84_010475 [Pisum sativum]
MREAVGSFVGWPSDLIFPDAETPTRPTHKAGKGISRRIESVASQKEVPGRKLKKAGNDIPTTSGTKSQIMMRLEKMVEESDIMHGAIRSVDFDEGVFGFAHSEIIAKEDMQQLFEHEELGIAVIHTYIWYMYVTLMWGTELCNRFNFIAASRINTTFITKNPTSVKNELVDRFMAADDNTTPSLYFLPFNSGNGGHWVLVAMDLSRLMVYYLDSLSGDWSKYPSMKKTTMDCGRRNTKKYSFRCPDLKELRKLSFFLLDPLDFKQRHGKLLSVSSADVVEELLSILVQFYDPLYRCFTFPDYQLVPTLEEYAHLLGMPVSDKVPFSGLEEILISHVIVESLHLKKYEIYAHLVKKGGIIGLTSEFLIGRAIVFAQVGSMNAFKAIFVLLIYGLTLFPNIDGFVDVNSIRIFLIRNLILTLLGDMYFSLHLRNSKGGGTIVCCVTLLYKWFISHLPQTPAFLENKQCLWWSQRLMSLTNDDIV